MTDAAGARHKAGTIPIANYAEEDVPASSIDKSLENALDSGSEYLEAPSVHGTRIFEVEEILEVRPDDHGDSHGSMPRPAALPTSYRQHRVLGETAQSPVQESCETQPVKLHHEPLPRPPCPSLSG